MEEMEEMEGLASSSLCLTVSSLLLGLSLVGPARTHTQRRKQIFEKAVVYRALPSKREWSWAQKTGALNNFSRWDFQPCPRGCLLPFPLSE